ncbi:MAG: ribokinase [Gammaproteobacteria bacterium]|nr:ribokinase [Gammaproteobacteria bacterium]
MNIAVIGSNMVDLTSYITRMPRAGETLEAPDFKIGCGGKGANQAIAASRLGSDVLMVTRVGNDIFADNTIANFKNNGIDTRYVMRTDASSGVAPIFVDPNSQNSIIIVKGANNLLTANDIHVAAKDIQKCQLIVLQLEIPTETAYAAIRFGSDHNIPVLLNPAPAQPDLILEKVKECEFIIPNETELSLLTGMPVETIEDTKNAAGALNDAGVKNVIITMGSRGVLWIDNQGNEQIFPAINVNARDTTGAGDAFIGCFASVYVKSKNIEQAITIANYYAADSVSRLGTQTSYLDKKTFLKHYPELSEKFIN